MSAGAALLSVAGLVKHFPIRQGLVGTRPLRAVDGVDLELRPAETLAVVGESGCGKSTLARLLVGLIPPTRGEVTFEAKSVTHARGSWRRDMRRDLQIIFQDPYSSLNPRMTVGTIVERPLIIHRMGDRAARKEAVAELFRSVGLPVAFIGRYPHELSGGQRQRVAIARALATRPKLVVADEPTSGLDVSVQAKILNLLKSLQRQHALTYVLISHDMRVVRYMADRVAVMYLGKVVEITTKERIFIDPQHPYTQALLAAVPNTDPSRRAARAPVQGDPPSPLDPPAGCRFHPRCPFSRDICRTDEPQLLPHGEGHLTACHLVDEIRSLPAPGPMAAQP